VTGQKVVNSRAKVLRTDGNESQQPEKQSTPQREQKPAKQLPPASKAVWDTRIRKREEGLDNFKQGDEYNANQRFHNPRRTLTPNAHDKGLSKRDWEKQIADWRRDNRSEHYVRELVNEGFDEDTAAVAFASAKEDMGKIRHILCVQKLVDMGVEQAKAEVAAQDADDNLERAVQELFGK
jgi:hypothetical protein